MEFEIDLVKAIFPEAHVEKIENTSKITIPIFPSSISIQPFVSFDLIFFCEIDYPQTSPRIHFEHFVGISDAEIDRIKSNVQEIILHNPNEEVIMLVIDFCRESIDSNTPSVDCSICLRDMKDNNAIMRTSKGHLFHKFCIGRYLSTTKMNYELEIEELLSKDPNRPIDQLPKLFYGCPLCKDESIENFDELITSSQCKDPSEDSPMPETISIPNYWLTNRQTFLNHLEKQNQQRLKFEKEDKL